MIAHVSVQNVALFMVSCDRCHRVQNPVDSTKAARQWLHYHECRP